MLVFGDPVSIAQRDRISKRSNGVPAPDRTTSFWRLKSREVIAGALKANPGTAMPELKKRMSAAYPFGMREYTPYKIWLQEVKAALAEVAR